jgi:NAD(P)-dependent dehydrogenase (short-subunit alcohol dehydrogenase family)
MTLPSSLKGRTVVITGAIRRIATVFSKAGANLVLMARARMGLHAVAEQLDPDRSVAMAGDVTSPRDLRRNVEHACTRFGRLDVFCHNAGIYRETALEDVTLDEWHAVIDTNLPRALLPEIPV